jgi:ATP-dependent DNA ligase
MLNNLHGIRPRPWRPPRRLRGARRRSPPSWPRPVLAEAVFRHACKLGLEGIVSKRKDSPYRSGRSPDWLKMKNPDAPAVKREAEKDWGKDRWR